MSAKTLSLIGSIVFLALTAMGFVWLWSTSRPDLSHVLVSESLKPVEIESIKSDAESLLKNVENNASLPIPIPLEKMGRDNPFAGI